MVLRTLHKSHVLAGMHDLVDKEKLLAILLDREYRRQITEGNFRADEKELLALEDDLLKHQKQLVVLKSEAKKDAGLSAMVARNKEGKAKLKTILKRQRLQQQAYERGKLHHASNVLYKRELTALKQKGKKANMKAQRQVSKAETRVAAAQTAQEEAKESGTPSEKEATTHQLEIANADASKAKKNAFKIYGTPSGNSI